MRKLELKHLAPYLPYGLKLYQHREDLNLDLESTMIGLVNGAIKVTSARFPFSEDVQYYEVKPILRPLSDLDKLSDDVLINEHSINLMLEEKYDLDYGVFSHYKGQLDIELDGDSGLMYDQNKSIPLMAVLDIQSELLKGHYDIFGLIEQGLAIDINTLNKEK